MPRHPPYALRNLIFFTTLAPERGKGCKLYTLQWVLAYYFLLSLLVGYFPQGAPRARVGNPPTEIASRQRTGWMNQLALRQTKPSACGATGIRTPDPLLAKQVL